MGVWLKPIEGEAIPCNWWNWRPTVALLMRHDLPTGEAREIAEATNGDILSLSETEALRAADIIDDMLRRIPEDGRVLLEGSITTERDSGEFFRDPDQQSKNYSATKAWLIVFRDFCLRCKGFTAS